MQLEPEISSPAKGDATPLRLTLEQRQAIRAFEPEVLKSVGISKALQHLGLEKQARTSKLGHLFWKLRLQGGDRDLSAPDLAEAIQSAAKRNDDKFFVELGRLLSMKPVSDSDIKAQITPLEGFLLRNWIRPEKQYQFSLCYYSLKACRQFIEHFKGPGYSFPAVSHDILEKTIRRLGLKKGKFTLFDGIEIKNAEFSPIPRKKFGQESSK